MIRGKFLKRLRWAALAIVVFVLLLFYGPYEPFRLLWINTALYSSHFKFLATGLYSKKYIASVLDKNTITADYKTNDGEINITGGNGLQVASIKGNYYTGHIIKIDDPRRLFMVSSPDSQGLLLEDFVEGHRALGGVNASGYTGDKERGKTWGISIAGGEMISRCPGEDRHVMGGFTGEYKLVVGTFTDREILEKQYLWAFEFGPILVVNGEKTPLSEFSGGLAPRTAIGQTQDGAVLLVTADGRHLDSVGATYKDMQTILHANGAVNAIGLDGGSSSTMVYQGLVINRPSDSDEERRLPNAILFKGD